MDSKHLCLLLIISYFALQAEAAPSPFATLGTVMATELSKATQGSYVRILEDLVKNANNTLEERQEEHRIKMRASTLFNLWPFTQAWWDQIVYMASPSVHP